MKKAAFVFVILMLGACGQIDEQQNDKSDGGNPSLQNTKSEISRQDNTGNSDEERADYLAELASNIPHVKNATAVVAGEYAIIGIDVDKDLDRSKVGSIKYSVSESIKHDPAGAGAVVVADPDINARLKEIKDDMSEGRPIQGIINELADITGRLVPELPPRENDKNPQEVPQKQDEEMDKQDSRQIKKEQNKQSTE
ncbi:YhcN/YlaJ family sporulation lipoprotein [Siminovitchia fordii]|uniref:Lipoprotein YlaJ n=1 Tax=Siminovitchia fordii TaxID=254759 RepID=A0ABQ4K2G4_9BACI|nr:YhcN/YlaJ family sporulation lipoprotein [Siminovitchia fordii]GIN19078.1 putative lipoprotein YlaJ [Siminovitchia fordii]